MSAPKLTDIRLGDRLESAPKLHVLQGGDSLVEAYGSKGAFVAGGPVLAGQQYRNLQVVAQAISAAQLVGGYICFADNAGAAATLTLPSPGEILRYLSQQYFKAQGAAADIVGGLTAAPIPLSSFDCVFTVGSGNVPSLALNGIEYYPTGPANAALAGPIALVAGAVQTFRFICIDNDALAPRIGMTPLANSDTGSATNHGSARNTGGGAQTIATGVTVPAALDVSIFDSGGVVDLANDQLDLLNNSVYQINCSLGYGLGAPASAQAPANNRLRWSNNGAVTDMARDSEKIHTGEIGGQCTLSTIIRTGAVGPQFVYLQLQSVAAWGQTMIVDHYYISAVRIGPA